MKAGNAAHDSAGTTARGQDAKATHAMQPFSLRNRLLGSLATALLLAWGLAAALTYFGAYDELEDLGDLRLQQAAQAYALADEFQLTSSTAPGTGSASIGAHVHAADSDDGPPPLFQRFDRSGRLLFAAPDGPPAPFDRASGVKTTTVDGVAYRTAAVWHDGEQTRVFERRDARRSAATRVALRLLTPLFVLLPLLAVLAWWLTSRGLKPLLGIARSVEGRNATNLAPVQPSELPAEAAPLVAAVNGLLARLSAALDKERRFTADAAHELRTPLAGLKLQAQVALASTDDQERDSALAALLSGVDRASHLFEQLLSLARADRGEGIARTSVDLDAAARRAAAACAAFAADKHIDLSVDAEHMVHIEAAPPLIDAMLRNLVDNAVRYSPPGARVEIVVDRQGDRADLTVRDDGPGIARESRDRALQRFTRLAGQEVQGSGLGLSIVARIAELHGARLHLDAGIDGRGLRVTVSFAAC